jgi:hypothetical protein
VPHSSCARETGSGKSRGRLLRRATISEFMGSSGKREARRGHPARLTILPAALRQTFRGWENAI